ncbi:exo-alpha-sialidase, partial [Pseudomonas aeruginosa]|nr:exo-alpha-sialidase [Pseudomonas aeruginosa]
MSERLYVGTRKGLFELRRNAAGQWLPMASHFLGEPLSMCSAVAVLARIWKINDAG